MKKCDIVIPIYNSPEWVKMCVYALFKNTPKEYINKVYLMNDNSDELTCNCIENLRNKYGEIIEVYKNEQNLGFIKNVNRGLEMTKADYVLLLNTDCMVSKNTIPKLIAHIEKNTKIGLICPISSNAANLSLDIFENYSYMQMDEILYNNFKGMSFDACTVVGNCLLITKDCIDKVGFLDEAYGMGYGDETDYQFKAETKGFEAKVAIDTYVFHKSEVSFGVSEEKQKKLEHNREIFFERWGEQYNKKMEKYIKNDPIKYINKNIKINEKPSPEILFFLPDIHQNAGGVHVVVDLVNYLNINGVFANILTERIHPYEEIMLFSPSYLSKVNNIKPKCIVGTIYPTIFFCNAIANHFEIPSVNFMQGYEPCFDNGEVYEWAELACRSSQNILAISEFLKQKCKDNFDKDATVIPNGINIDLLYNKNKVSKDKKVITFAFRDNYAKGDFILMDVLKKLLNRTENNIEINVIYPREVLFPINNGKIKVNMYKGPLPRKKVTEILFKSDIYVDASLLEGFGLMGLEAMAAGAVPVMSNSFGVSEYAIDKENSFIVQEVNNANRYVEKINMLVENPNLLKRMSEMAQKKSKLFDIDNRISEYISYFRGIKIENIDLTDKEINKMRKWKVNEKDLFFKTRKVDENDKSDEHIFISRKRRIYNKFLSIIPRGMKSKLKRVLKKMINE